MFRVFVSSATPRLLDPVFPDWVNELMNYWIDGSVTVKIAMIIGIISFIGFLYAALGIFLGLSESPKIFLALSILLVVWNGIVLIQRWLVLEPPFTPLLGSCAALFIAMWYFRQPNIDQYFGGDGKSSHIFTTRVLNIPLDLVLAILFGSSYVILRLISFINLFLGY
jgi:hypothetical protein